MKRYQRKQRLSRPGINAEKLKHQLEIRNIRVATGEPFFAGKTVHANSLRLCLANMGVEQIRAGLLMMIEEMRGCK